MRCVTCGEPNPKAVDPCPSCGAGAAPAHGPRSAAELEAAFAAEDEPPTRSGPLRPGQDFGTRYTILKLLGQGGMGVVYQALDRDLNVLVALKVLRPTGGNPRAAAELHRRFKTELLLARKVTHRHVIRIHDIGEIDGIRFITMPFVQGRDLAVMLKDGPLPVVTALRYARQIAAGLVAAHGAGVIHRDLKPANIMIGDDGNALLMDFGIARSSVPGTPQRTIAGAVVGTAAYMAPEQARGETVDQRADIYAFGLILHEMLCGPRFMPKGAVADLYARLTAPPAPTRAANAAVPEALDAIVTKCVQPQADDRYQTAMDLATALAALSRRGRGPVPGAAGSSRRWWTPLATAAVLLLVLGAGYWLAGQTNVRVMASGSGSDAADETAGASGRSAPAGANAAAAVQPNPVAAPPAHVRTEMARAAEDALTSPETARRTYARLASAAPPAASFAAAGVADLELMRQHHAAAAEMLERAIAMDLRARNLAATAPKYLALAEARIGEGRPDIALAAVGQALAASRHESVLLPAARLYISLDRPADAAAIARELAVDTTGYGATYADVVEAELALDRGDAQRAIDTLSGVIGEHDLWIAHYLLGMAYLDARRYDEAFAQFEACRQRRREAASLYFDYMPTLRYLSLLESAMARTRAASARPNVAITGR